MTVEQLTVDHYFAYFSFGPSGVRALPLAAGINEGGHYFLGIFGPSVLRAPAEQLTVDHYFAYFSFSSFLLLLLGTAVVKTQ